MDTMSTRTQTLWWTYNHGYLLSHKTRPAEWQGGFCGILRGMNRDTRILVEDLIEKWRDVLDSSENRTEQTLSDEIVDDLKSVMRCLAVN